MHNDYFGGRAKVDGGRTSTSCNGWRKKKLKIAIERGNLWNQAHQGLSSEEPMGYRMVYKITG